MDPSAPHRTIKPAPKPSVRPASTAPKPDPPAEPPKPTRRRISRARHVVDALVLTVVVAAWVAYLFLTDTAWISGQASRVLARLSGGQVRIRSATVSLTDGLHLFGVEVTPPSADSNDPRLTDPEPPIFTAVELHLTFDLSALLKGRLRIANIVATNPVVNLITDDRTGEINWQRLRPVRSSGRRSGRPPTVRLRDGTLLLHRRTEGSTRLLEHFQLDAVAVPRREGRGYSIRWESASRPGAIGRAEFDPIAWTFRTAGDALPAVSFDAAASALALPPAVHRWLDVLGLAGTIRPVNVSVDRQGTDPLVVELVVDRARMSIPLDAAETDAPPDERFLRLRDVSGRLRLTGSTIHVDLHGEFDPPQMRMRPPDALPARFRLQGQLEVDLTKTPELNNVGFDLKLTATNVPIPEHGPDAPSAARRFVQRWPRLHRGFRIYDPHGTCDLFAELSKAPGRGEAVVVREVTLSGHGTAMASYQYFPYRLTELSGSVTFRPDGVFLRDLTGYHQGDFVRINGRLTSSRWYAGVTLDIEGTNVRLTSDLRDALIPKYQVFWRRFNPQGRADIHVRLARDEGSPETERKRWTTEIDVDFRDGAARYEGFPYPLAPLTGRLSITPDRIVIENLQAGNGSTTVTFNGHGFHSGPRVGTMDLRIAATDLPIDAALKNALPVDARRALESLNLTGQTDLAGRLFLVDGRRVGFNVTAHVHGATLRADDLPYRLESVTAELGLTPDRIDIRKLEGSHDGAILTVTGTIRRGEGEPDVALEIRSDALPLTPELRDALPARLRALWKTLEPRGSVKIAVDVHRASDADSAGYETRTVIEALGNEITYAPFPLPLHDVQGRFVVRGDETQLIGITARHGEARLSLDGSIRRIEAALRGELKLTATGMAFTDALREAVPWRVRRTWNRVKPAGRFDLTFDDLSFFAPDEGQTIWAFEGQTRFHDARFTLGMTVEGVNGVIAGRGSTQGGGAGFGIDARLKLDRVTLDDRELTNLTATIRRGLDDPLLRIDDVTAEIYGGQCTARAEVRFDERASRYGLSAFVRGMDLEGFLNAARDPKAPPLRAPGTVSGSFYLAGTAGRPESRQGKGEIHVSQARLYQVPVFLSILQVGNVSVPDATATQDGVFRFHLDGDRVIFDQVVLRDKALTLVGRGSARTSDKVLDLTLLIGSGRPLPRVPVLTELLEGAARELMVVRVQGPLGNPRITAQPLRSVDAALKMLLTPREPPAVRPQRAPNR